MYVSADLDHSFPQIDNHKIIRVSLLRTLAPYESEASSLLNGYNKDREVANSKIECFPIGLD